MKRTQLKTIITNSLREDAYTNDVTTNALIGRNQTSEGYIIAKEECVLCGLDVAKQVFKKLDKNIRISSKLKDGRRVKKGVKILNFKGKTRAILTGERVALNFLGYLSGIATKTNMFVKAAHPNKPKILDTRKTTPTLRALEKYAVQCGGGSNHRFDLSDMVLIKDNHLIATGANGNLGELIKKSRKKTRKKIQIEVDTIAQLKKIINSNPDYILLDNMGPAKLKQAIKIVKSKKGKKPQLEASGGITLKNIKQIAKTGIDRISLGTLTHTHKSIDFSLELKN